MNPILWIHENLVLPTSVYISRLPIPTLATKYQGEVVDVEHLDQRSVQRAVVADRFCGFEIGRFDTIFTTRPDKAREGGSSGSCFSSCFRMVLCLINLLVTSLSGTTYKEHKNVVLHPYAITLLTFGMYDVMKFSTMFHWWSNRLTIYWTVFGWGGRVFLRVLKRSRSTENQYRKPKIPKLCYFCLGSFSLCCSWLSDCKPPKYWTPEWIGRKISWNMQSKSSARLHHLYLKNFQNGMTFEFFFVLLEI